MLKRWEKKIAKHLTKNPPNNCPSGVECKFIDMGNGYGVKRYTSRTCRNYAHDWQTIAAQHGLGPRVFGKFNIRTADKILYCYITEVVRSNVCYQCHERRDLINGLDALGFPTYDVAYQNMGRDATGRLICVDFGGGYAYISEP